MNLTNYVATEQDIQEITTTYLAGIAAADGGRLTYLRALIGTAQHELGATPRPRARAAKPAPEETARQLAALQGVHERFYTVVTRVVGESIPAGKDKAEALNRRTNFARTALYTVRLWVRAGNDLRGVAAGKATKASLTVAVTPRPLSTTRLRNRTEARSKAFVAALLELAEKDRGAAIKEADSIMGQLAGALVKLGVKPTRNQDEATAQHRPLQIGSTVFMPTETQILRPSRPS